MKNNHFLNTEYQSVFTQTDGDIEEVELLVRERIYLCLKKKSKYYILVL